MLNNGTTSPGDGSSASSEASELSTVISPPSPFTELEFTETSAPEAETESYPEREMYESGSSSMSSDGSPMTPEEAMRAAGVDSCYNVASSDGSFALQNAGYVSSSSDFCSREGSRADSLPLPESTGRLLAEPKNPAGNNSMRDDAPQAPAAEGLKCDADPPPADGGVKSRTLAVAPQSHAVLRCSHAAASKKRGLDNHAPTGGGGGGGGGGGDATHGVRDYLSVIESPAMGGGVGGGGGGGVLRETTESIQVCVDPPPKKPRDVLALAPLLGATVACTTVVIVGTMDEGQLQDRPFQRRLLGISVAGQYLELGGNQKHLALVGLLMCLVAAMVIFLVELRRRWQLSCKDPWKNLATGRNCKDLEAALQERLGIDPSEQDLKVLVEGIWFHIERPEVVAGALTAVLKIMAGPHAAKVFQVPAVADEKADENARKAFGVGVLEVTLASMEKHRSRDDVLAPACGVVWAINASPKAVDIRVDTAARGGIPLLCGALGSFDVDPVIVEASLSAMINLMYENDDNKGAVMAARVRLNNEKEASVVERAIELLNADRLLWYEPSSNGTYLLHAGVQESALNVLRKLANTPPLFTQSTAKELLQELDVVAHVQATRKQPHASVHLKEDGQKFIDNLRRRKNVPEADAHD